MSWFIIKEAVYMHGVYGPYDTRQDALGAFFAVYDDMKSKAVVEYEDDGYFHNQFDGHHDYYITDKLPAFDGESWDGDAQGFELIKHDMIPTVNRE